MLWRDNMASIQDVADQINGKLDAINANTSATADNTAESVGLLQNLFQQANETNTRLENLGEGLFALIELQRTANHLLNHHRLQNDAIICELVNGNDLLCSITRKLTAVVDNGDETLVSVQRIEGISERVHTAEAGDYDRALDVQAKIDACCPPRENPPVKCPPTCDQPGFDGRKPAGQDWEPLTKPDPVG